VEYSENGRFYLKVFASNSRSEPKPGRLGDCGIGYLLAKGHLKAAIPKQGEGPEAHNFKVREYGNP